MTPRGLPHHMTAAECARLKRLREVHTLDTCALLMGRSVEALRRCIARGFEPYRSPKRRPRPSDFALLADTMSISDLARHYRTGQATVSRWAAEVARKHKSRGTRRAFPRPADLAERIAELGIQSAVAHYGVSYDVVQRWREEAGLPVRYKRRTLERRARNAPGKIGWADTYAAERRAQSNTEETRHV